MSNPGWECPKCGSVYAPWVKRCDGCPKATKPPPLPEGVRLPDDFGGCLCVPDSPKHIRPVQIHPECPRHGRSAQ